MTDDFSFRTLLDEDQVHPRIMVCAKHFAEGEFGTECVCCQLERAKAIIERNKTSPVHRLHNLCDALHEHAEESPFSREAWEEQDKQIAEVNRKNEELKNQLEAVTTVNKRLLERLEIAQSDRGYIHE